MKRIIALAVVCAMSLMLFGCGKKGGSGSGSNDQNKPGQTEAAADEGKDDGKGAASDAGIGVSRKDDMTVFKVDHNVNLTQNAWLGFCPGTKGYVEEEDADEYDVIYVYICNEDYQPGDDYIFEFGDEWIGGLEDGDYVGVLCDDDNDGKVMLYFPAVIKDGKLKCDLDKIVVNK